MSQIITDHAEAWQKLLVRVSRARTVRISTPWLSDLPVSQLLEALPERATFRLIFRWPQTGSDVGPLDTNALRRLLQASRSEPGRIWVEWLDARLHAKVYLVDGLALVGSANLTGTGFGLHPDGDSNLEVGTWMTAPADTRHLRSWFDDLEGYPLDEEALRILEDSRGHFSDPPKPPRPPRDSAKGPIERAIALGEQLGVFRDPRPASFGRLRHVRDIRLRGVSKRLWQFSTSRSGDGGFHFDTRPSHIRVHGGRRLGGLVYVPAAGPEAGPVVLVPIDDLYEPRHGLRKKVWDRYENMVRVTVRDFEEQWWLVLHHATGASRIRAAAALEPLRGAPRFLRLRRNAWLQDPATVATVVAGTRA